MWLLFVTMSLGTFVNAYQTMTKVNLQQLGEFENMRIRQKYSGEIIHSMYNDILESAKQGATEYVVEFAGCDHIGVQISHKTCHDIAEDVFGFFTLKFPDSAIRFNSESRVYTISWV